MMNVLKCMKLCMFKQQDLKLQAHIHNNYPLSEAEEDNCCEWGLQALEPVVEHVQFHTL